MGSTGPGLTALPPGRAPRPEPALLPPARDPDTHSWGCPDSPSPPGTPEQPVPAFCLHYFDMLYTEDIAWATKGTGDPSPSGAPGGRGEAPKEPEQCPIIDSQGPALGAGGALPGSLALEEHSLEQVQSLVLGEVLKDIETACKLLNIPAGGCPPGAAGRGPTTGCSEWGTCWDLSRSAAWGLWEVGLGSAASVPLWALLPAGPSSPGSCWGVLGHHWGVLLGMSLLWHTQFQDMLRLCRLCQPLLKAFAVTRGSVGSKRGSKELDEASQSKEVARGQCCPRAQGQAGAGAVGDGAQGGRGEFPGCWG